MIIINGKRFDPDVFGSVSAVSITGGTVRVNGKVIAEGLSGVIDVKWEGPLASLESDSSVTCGDVQGSVSAGSSVSCGKVGGSVNAGSSVHCDAVGGSVNAGSSVSCRR